MIILSSQDFDISEQRVALGVYLQFFFLIEELVSLNKISVEYWGWVCVTIFVWSPKKNAVLCCSDGTFLPSLLTNSRHIFHLLLPSNHLISSRSSSCLKSFFGSLEWAQKRTSLYTVSTSLNENWPFVCVCVCISLILLSLLCHIVVKHSVFIVDHNLFCFLSEPFY